MEERRGGKGEGRVGGNVRLENFPYGVIAVPLRFVNLESRGIERERYRRVLLRCGPARR